MAVNAVDSRRVPGARQSELVPRMPVNTDFPLIKRWLRAAIVQTDVIPDEDVKNKSALAFTNKSRRQLAKGSHGRIPKASLWLTRGLSHLDPASRE